MTNKRPVCANCGKPDDNVHWLGDMCMDCANDPEEKE